MARPRAVLTVATLAGTLGACGVVEGLSQYNKGDCSEDCGDAAPDVTTTEAGRDAPPESASTDENDTAADGGPDGPDGVGTTWNDGSSGDDSSGNDADAGGSGGGDSGDGGCGPLSSVQNCGGCGVACDMTTGTPSCTGATCTYVCTSGRADCDSDAMPDTNGCECATPGCCPSGCQTTHADGVGQSYYDCNPLSTFTEVGAISACTAYALSVGGTAADCSGGWTCNGSNGSSVQTVCYATGKNCGTYCWSWMDAGVGGPGSVVDCSCPGKQVGTWN